MVDYTPRRPPLEHQAKGLEFADREGYALLCEFGTGKSYILANTVGLLYRMGKIRGALVLAPKGMYNDWGVDDPNTSHWVQNLDPSVMEETRVYLWRGGHSRKEQETLAFVSRWSGLGILVMNTEALSAGVRAKGVLTAFLKARGACLMAIDESTFIRSPSAQRTKAVVKLGGEAAYRRILTGLPTPKSSLDLYTQFFFLDWRILGAKSYFAYRARYAVMKPMIAGGRTFQVVVGYQRTDELWSKIAPHSLRVRADDCLDLPERIYTRRAVELSGEQERIYRQMRDQCQVEIEGQGFASATLVLTQIMRLHQICCGHLTIETGVVVDVPTRKIEQLLELAQEDGGKIVVWSHFVPSLQLITRRLGEEFGEHSVVTYYGATADVDRAIAKERFATDPDCRFFVANQQTGGRGLNDLIVSRHAVFYSNPPDLELRLNAEARTRRKGSEALHTSVVYTDLTVMGTVEERIVKALRERIDIAGVVVGDGWREWLV